MLAAHVQARDAGAGEQNDMRWEARCMAARIASTPGMAAGMIWAFRPLDFVWIYILRNCSFLPE